MPFNKFRFKGTFRDYQQNVLDNSAEYLENRKIHIVAAPGSGKTILGLELMMRLSSPALILSPSVTIRQQWGERFSEGFIPDGSAENINDILSYSLKSPKLLTSITYQALHAAYNKKVSDEAPEDSDDFEKSESEDFSSFDLLKTMKAAGVKTICLDEAHHLKSEWQKALEAFISSLKNEVTVIALTATPPYDSSLSEWNKYISLCGEIDAEIFIPQLVKQKTLCPHQDYIYFSYPTKEETNLLNSFRQRAMECVKEIISGENFKLALDFSKLLQNYMNMEKQIFDNDTKIAALLSLANRAGIIIPPKLIQLTSLKGLPSFTLETAETALNFIIKTPNLFGEIHSSEIKKAVYKHGFIDNSSVCLTADMKIKKMLSSSMGKLSGINIIVQEECRSLGNNLRMLILTDYIKKDAMHIINTDSPINTMGTVPIFESVRRAVGDNASIALLSGSLVIVPNDTIERISLISQRQNVDFRAKNIANSKYSELVFSGSNKNKVSVITEAFQSGILNIVIGTKSLLGEGWDSPCINSLILASFVGSFMLSNQMRGRAIRTDKYNPDKTSNIWHLVTIEPPLLFTEKLMDPILSHNKIVSNDYDTLVRRFKGFLAPAYNSNFIESGIERIDIIKPPFDEEGFEKINRQTLTLAANRNQMATRWNAVLDRFDTPQVSDACDIPKTIRPKGFLMLNISAVLLYTALAASLIIGIYNTSIFNDNISDFGTIIILLASSYFILNGLAKIINFISPENAVKSLASCLLKTMKTLGMIKSPKARAVITSSVNGYSNCVLINATAHEKEIFSSALCEMMSAIENPRYVMIKRYRLTNSLSYTNSYSCPSIIGTNKDNVSTLSKYMRSAAGDFELIYTHSADGRKHLYKCRKKSYLNLNEVHLRKSKTVR